MWGIIKTPSLENTSYMRVGEETVSAFSRPAVDETRSGSRECPRRHPIWWQGPAKNDIFYELVSRADISFAHTVAIPSIMAMMRLAIPLMIASMARAIADTTEPYRQVLDGSLLVDCTDETYHGFLWGFRRFTALRSSGETFANWTYCFKYVPQTQWSNTTS